MELIDHRIKVTSYKDPIFWHHQTDLHRSAAGCDVKKWTRDVESIRAGSERGEVHLVTLGGDLANSIPHTDRRFDSTAVRPEFRDAVGDNLTQMECEKIIEEALPIRHCIVGAGAGNHEAAVKAKGDFDPTRIIAQGLNVPHMGYSAVIRLTVEYEDVGRSAVAIVYWHHGFGASRSKGGKLGMLYALRDICQADVYLTGHVHEQVVFPATRLSVTRRGPLKLLASDVLYVNGGSYLRGHPVVTAKKGGCFDPSIAVKTDYAETKGYTPSTLGHSGFRIQMQRSTTKRDKDWTLAFRYMDFRE